MTATVDPDFDPEDDFYREERPPTADELAEREAQEQQDELAERGAYGDEEPW